MILTYVKKAHYYMKRNGMKKACGRAVDELHKLAGDTGNYRKWQKKNRTSAGELARQKRDASTFRPLIYVITPYQDSVHFRETAQSLKNQTYKNWKWLLACTAEEKMRIQRQLEKLRGGRIQPVYVIVDSGQADAQEKTARAVREAAQRMRRHSKKRGHAAAWMTLLAPADTLEPDAFYRCVKMFEENPGMDLCYTDEDQVEDGKIYSDPVFKPDFNLDMLRATNYFGHMVLLRADVVCKQDAWNPDYWDKADYDYYLRAVEAAGCIGHLPRAVYHARKKGVQDTAEWNARYKRLELPACARSLQLSGVYHMLTGCAVLNAHYRRTGIPASAECSKSPGIYYPACAESWQTSGMYDTACAGNPQTSGVYDTAADGYSQASGIYHTVYEWKETPMVSVNIPNKDHIDDLDTCVQSILANCRYPNYEIVIIENNSTQESTAAYYQKIQEQDKRVRVICWKGEYNYSRITNFGVSESKGEYILLLNNDTKVITPDFMEEMLGYCMREDVGVCGARLLYFDGTVQHAGVVIGLDGVCGEVFQGFPKEDGGYQNRIFCPQDYSAVTAACLMTKKSVFKTVRGFDARLAVAYNDIDYCLKVRRAGKLVVYNPFAVLYHYEYKSRGAEDTAAKLARYRRETDLFTARWADTIKKGDPYYNPNLTKRFSDFSLKRIGFIK